MAFEGTKLDRMPVTITGAWYPEPQRWRWEGLARASEPLVGIVLCEQSRVLRWARSDHRASDSGLPVALFAHRHGSRIWIYAGIGRPSGRGLVQAQAVAPSSDRPTIVLDTAVTGNIVPLARLPADATLTISVVLISRRDVRSRRVGLWGVRPSLLCDIGEPWRAVLQYGRTGELRM